MTSGRKRTWYKSNVCPVDSDYRLMAKGDEVVQTITWPGVRSATLAKCADEAVAEPKSWRVFGPS